MSAAPPRPRPPLAPLIVRHRGILMEPWLSCCSIIALALMPLAPLPWAPDTVVRALPTGADAVSRETAPLAPASARFVSGRSGVGLRFGGHRVPYRVMGVFALPGEAVPIDLEASGPGWRLEA